MHASESYGGSWPVVILQCRHSGLVVGEPAFRLFENSFWSLHALGIQPAYAIVERFGTSSKAYFPAASTTAELNTVRAAGAAMSGLLIGAVAFALAAAAWPASRWMGSSTDLSSPHLLVPIAFANAVVIFGVYFAFAAVAWGVADAAMAQPRGFVLLRDLP